MKKGYVRLFIGLCIAGFLLSACPSPTSSDSSGTNNSGGNETPYIQPFTEGSMSSPVELSLNQVRSAGFTDTEASWYSLTLPEEAQYTIMLYDVAPAYEADEEIHIYMCKRSGVDPETFRGSTSLSYSAEQDSHDESLSDGTWYMKIKGSDAGHSFKLLIISSEGSMEAPVSVPLDETRISGITSTGTSWYTFTAPEDGEYGIMFYDITPAYKAGETIEVFMNQDSGTDPEEDEESVHLTYYSESNYQNHNLDAGTWYMKVKTAGSGHSYKLYVMPPEESGGGEEEEEAGTYDDPTLLTLGTQKSLDTSNTMEHYLSFDAAETGADYRITLTALSSVGVEINIDTGGAVYSKDTAEGVSPLYLSARGEDILIRAEATSGNSPDWPFSILVEEVTTNGRWESDGIPFLGEDNISNKAIAIDPVSGVLWAVYTENSQLHAYRYNETTNSWTEESGIPEHDSVSTFSFCITSSGTPFIVYKDLDESHYYGSAAYFDGTNWQQAGERFGLYGTTPDTIRLLADSQNRVHAFYADNEEDNSLYYQVWDGSEWIEECFDENISTRDFEVVLDDDENPWLISSLYGGIWKWVPEDGLDWATGDFEPFTDTAVNFSGSTSSIGPVSIAMTSDGTMWASFKYNADNIFRLARYNSTEWEIVREFPENMTPISLTANGNELWVYLGGASGHEGCKGIDAFDGSNWEQIGERNIGYGDMDDPVILIDNDEAYIAYKYYAQGDDWESNPYNGKLGFYRFIE